MGAHLQYRDVDLIGRSVDLLLLQDTPVALLLPNCDHASAVGLTKPGASLQGAKEPLVRAAVNVIASVSNAVLNTNCNGRSRDWHQHGRLRKKKLKFFKEPIAPKKK